MKYKLLTLLMGASILVSCKKEANSSEEVEKTGNNFLSLHLETYSAKTDDFAMYFTEDGTNNFKDINAVWGGVKGGKSQNIQFKLTEDIIPTQIRLDFGLKKDQDSVVIKNIKVDYYGNTYQFKGSDFFNYFIKDEQFLTKTDAVKGTLTILSKDGVYKTPYYYPTQLTIDKLKEITTKK